MYHLCYNGTRIRLEELNGDDWHTDDIVKAAEKRIPVGQRKSLEYCIVRTFIDKSPIIKWDQRKSENGFGTIPEIFYPQRTKVLV